MNLTGDLEKHYTPTSFNPTTGNKEEGCMYDRLKNKQLCVCVCMYGCVGGNKRKSC